MRYEVGFKLICPVSGCCEAIFAGYTEDDNESWFTGDFVEVKTFEGFTEDGWCAWKEKIETFVKNVNKIRTH